MNIGLSDIQKELSRIEKENRVRILYAVESGSRAWGFASRNSDFDVRFIYIHPLTWDLAIDRQLDLEPRIAPSTIFLTSASHITAKLPRAWSAAGSPRGNWMTCSSPCYTRSGN